MKPYLSAEALKASYANPLNVKLARALGSNSASYDRISAHTNVAVCLSKKPTSAKELSAAIVNFDWMIPLANDQFDNDSNVRAWAEKCFEVYTEVTKELVGA